MSAPGVYVPDLAPLSMAEIDAYALPILAAAAEARARAVKFAEMAERATSVAAREFCERGARTHVALADGYSRQAEPYLAEWERRGCPERPTMTRQQFVKTDPRDLVTFPEGRAPVVAPKPARMSDKAYYAHIDGAGRVILTWRLAEDDGRRFEDVAADAVSARAFWTEHDRYNWRYPSGSGRRIYLSARWAD